MLTCTNPPAVEPVDLATAKDHLNVTASDFDALISGLVVAARRKLESYLSRAFIASGWRQTFDGFPGQLSRVGPASGSMGSGSFSYGTGPLFGYVPEWFLAGNAEPIIIPKAPLIAVSSITYLDTVGVRQTMDPATYSVEAGDGGRISPSYGREWPSARVYPGSVVVDATFGYGADPADVPQTIKQAMLLCVGHWFANREAVVDYAAVELPMAAKWLLASEDWGIRP